MKRKPIKLMTLEERREYGRIKQAERREAIKRCPGKLAAYRVAASEQGRKYRESLKQNPEKLEARKERARQRARDRYAREKYAQVENSGLQMLKDPS
jgi:hypothetical protein